MSDSQALPQSGPNEPEKHAAGTEAASRVADVLLLFTGRPDSFGVSAIARELSLSKAVVHRILQALVDRSLLASDPVTRTYRLGPAAAALGARSLRNSELHSVALPVLHELQRQTGETTTVSALIGRQRAYLEQVESTHEIKMTVEIGRRFPLHAGSSSICMLAFLPAADREAVLADPLLALTEETVVSADAMRVRLAQVHEAGFAQSDGERQEGAASVAAPVFALDGSVTGAVSVCGPSSRFNGAVRTACAPLVRRAADRISLGLGWRGGLPPGRGSG